MGPVACTLILLEKHDLFVLHALFKIYIYYFPLKPIIYLKISTNICSEPNASIELTELYLSVGCRIVWGAFIYTLRVNTRKVESSTDLAKAFV